MIQDTVRSKLRPFVSALTALSAVFLAACGQQGSDPATLAGDPGALPEMTFPVQITGTASASFMMIAPFVSGTRDGFEFYLAASSFGGTSMAVLAPIDGLVTKATSENNLGVIDIHFNGVYTIRLVGVNTFQVRAGDFVPRGALVGYVLQGNSLGTGNVISSGGGVRLTVIANGKAVCPLSFFAASSIQSMYSGGLFFANDSGLSGFGGGSQTVPCR